MRYLFGLCACTLLGANSFAAEPTETITVTGSATVYVKPDAARIHYTIRVSETSIDAAKESATKLVASLNEAVKSLKIPNLTSSEGSINYSRSVLTAAAARRLVGPGGGVAPGAPAAPAATYLAQIPLSVMIQEKDSVKLRSAVDTFVKKIVESGASIVGDALDSDNPFSAASSRSLGLVESPRIEWVLTDETSARKEAIRNAVRKAKADAEAVSKELGWETMKVISVGDIPPIRGDVTEVIVSSVRPPAGEVAFYARVTLKCSR